MTQTIASNVSILITKYGMAEDTARNLIGLSTNGIFASLNTEYHDALRLRPLLQRAMPKAAKLPKVYDIQV